MDHKKIIEETIKKLLSIVSNGGNDEKLEAAKLILEFYKYSETVFHL